MLKIEIVSSRCVFVPFISRPKLRLKPDLFTIRLKRAIILLQVTKPYASFFSDSNLESLRVKSSEAIKEEMVKRMEEKMVEMIDVGNAVDEDGGAEEDDFAMDVDDGGPDE